MKNNLFNNPALRKAIGIGSAIFAGMAAISGALADQRQKQEFEELKEKVSELQKNQ